MTPWEKRLADLGHILVACQQVYFSPELFRRNINQFLQTARTVTFIIQKHKSSIPNFAAWYEKAVRDAFASDTIMRWAVDARNAIEKEGDLETNSYLSLSLVFSYLEEEDLSIETARPELLGAGIKKLVRFARKRLPTSVSDAAAVRIERRWVADSLPDFELLNALTHIYSRHYDVCHELAEMLGHSIGSYSIEPREFRNLTDDARRVEYLKLSTMKRYEAKFINKPVIRGVDIPASVSRIFEDFLSSENITRTIDSTANYLTKMAEAVFNEHDLHAPILFLYDKDWRAIEFLSARFDDQTDKFIFWRKVGELARSHNAYGLSWTAEAWKRSLNSNAALPIRKQPIIGEQLQTLVIARDGTMRSAIWSIERKSTSSRPTLSRMADSSFDESSTYFFLVPVMRAFGLPDPPFDKSSPSGGR